MPTTSRERHWNWRMLYLLLLRLWSTGRGNTEYLSPIPCSCISHLSSTVPCRYAQLPRRTTVCMHVKSYYNCILMVLRASGWPFDILLCRIRKGRPAIFLPCHPPYSTVSCPNNYAHVYLFSSTTLVRAVHLPHHISVCLLPFHLDMQKPSKLWNSWLGFHRSSNFFRV